MVREAGGDQNTVSKILEADHEKLNNLIFNIVNLNILIIYYKQIINQKNYKIISAPQQNPNK